VAVPGRMEAGNLQRADGRGRVDSFHGAEGDVTGGAVRSAAGSLRVIQLRRFLVYLQTEDGEGRRGKTRVRGAMVLQRSLGTW